MLKKEHYIKQNNVLFNKDVYNLNSYYNELQEKITNATTQEQKNDLLILQCNYLLNKKLKEIGYEIIKFKDNINYYTKHTSLIKFKDEINAFEKIFFNENDRLLWDLQNTLLPFENIHLIFFFNTIHSDKDDFISQIFRKIKLED